jgi:putative salt-induced outer membrane protein YdiY
MHGHFRLAVTLLLAVGFVSLLAAQEAEPPEPPWSGNASLGVSLSRGNSDLTNISLTLNILGRLSKSIEWSNSGLFLFGKAGKVTNSETYQLASRANWQHTGRIFSYYEIQGIRDRLKNYSYRILSGVGVGYQLVSADNVSLAVSGGLTDVLTRYHDTGDTDSFLGITIGNQFVWKISGSAEFNQKWEWNFDTTEPEHFLSNLEANLITTLINNWSVKLTILNRHDSRPVGEGIKKNDISFLAGISAKF